MSQMIPFHPAPGLGDVFKGWMIVPQNPITTPGTPLVPSIQATAPNRMLRRPRLQELMAGAFVVPQNPLRQALGMGQLRDLMPGQFSVPQNPVRCGMSGMGCGCGGGCGGGGTANYTLNGMGQLDTSSVGNFFSSIPTWLTEPSSVFPGVSNWVLLLGGAIAVDLYLGKRGRR